MTIPWASLSLSSLRRSISLPLSPSSIILSLISCHYLLFLLSIKNDTGGFTLPARGKRPSIIIISSSSSFSFFFGLKNYNMKQSRLPTITIFFKERIFSASTWSGRKEKLFSLSLRVMGPLKRQRWG